MQFMFAYLVSSVKRIPKHFLFQIHQDLIANRLKYRIILNQNFKVKMHNPKSCTTICNNLEVCTQWKPYKREYRIQESRLDILVYTFPIFNV